MQNKDIALTKAKAKILKALGHPSRLWMVEQLNNGEKCVCELVSELDVDFSTVSKHLAILKDAGVVKMEKRGKQVFYSLRLPCVLNFINCVEEVIKSQINEQISLLK